MWSICLRVKTLASYDAIAGPFDSSDCCWLFVELAAYRNSYSPSESGYQPGEKLTGSAKRKRPRHLNDRFTNVGSSPVPGDGRMAVSAVVSFVTSISAVLFAARKTDYFYCQRVYEMVGHNFALLVLHLLLVCANALLWMFVVSKKGIWKCWKG